jgi:hypothetical protein
VEAGGIVRLVDVDSATATFLPLQINDPSRISNAAQLRVRLSTGISTAAIPRLDLITTPGGTNQCTFPTLVVENQQNRDVSLQCDATGVFLTLGAVRPTNQPQVNPALFTSNFEYCVFVRQDAGTFDQGMFLSAIDNSFAPGTTRSLISITNFGVDQSHDNDIRITFRCLDFSSVVTADQRCQTIINTANTQGGSFASSILATGVCDPTQVVGTEEEDDSNHGLYGLFGLLAIPLLCCLIIFLVVRNSRRRADNQYMQDAATFSNVASGPQPLATAVPAVQYDVAKEVYPVVSAPAIAYPGY